MASYVTPKKNTEFIFYAGLVSRSSRPQFQANPTLAAGDVKVSTDGGTLTNLGTLPTVTPASGKLVKVTLSASEMNGDNIAVVFSDAAGAEWDDLVVGIQTTSNQVDDLATGITTLLARIIGTLASGTHNPQSGDAYARLGAPAGASIAADIASVATNVSTLVNRIGAFTGSGINTVLGFLKAAMSKASSLTPSDVGGTFDNTTDSLEALSERVTSAEVTIVGAVDGSEITVYRGTTWDIDLTVGDITGNSKVWFTVKEDLENADTDAILQVEKTAGLVRFNGAAGTAGDATLTVNSAATGEITVTVKPSTTVNAALQRGLSFDVKVLIGTTVTEKYVGTFSVSGDVTRAVS